MECDNNNHDKFCSQSYIIISRIMCYDIYGKATVREGCNGHIITHYIAYYTNACDEK